MTDWLIPKSSIQQVRKHPDRHEEQPRQLNIVCPPGLQVEPDREVSQLQTNKGTAEVCQECLCLLQQWIVTVMMCHGMLCLLSVLCYVK